MYPPVDIPRPTTREECRGEQRPCPWVACKHHLYLDINPETGSIKINFPELEPWELQHTCALDVAERGGITLEEVGEIMNLTRERIRQVEVRGLLKLKMGSPSPDELGAELLAQGAEAKAENELEAPAICGTRAAWFAAHWFQFRISGASSSWRGFWQSSAWRSCRRAERRRR